MVLSESDSGPHLMFCGLWYVDRFVRTDAGWRIKERVEEKCYMHVFPKP
jgi:SnoaL-like domain